MFERYTEKARRVNFFARQEASQYGNPYIETERLLLGLFREDHRLAQKHLNKKGGAQSLRYEIESQIKRGERLSTAVEVPLSAASKRILNMAAEESERLGQKHVGAEHLLLGILRENDCWAARLLTERGLTLDGLREELAHPSADLRRKQPRKLLPCGRSWTHGRMAKRLTLQVCSPWGASLWILMGTCGVVRHRSWKLQNSSSPRRDGP
jgi:ATP-dependent Clp protease ATP-binding subunit ClpC